MNRVKLKELLIIQNGRDYKNLSAGDIPVYGSGGVMTYVNDYLFDGESILLPRKGTLDNITYVNGKFWTVDTMYWSKINDSLVYPRYLYLYLSSLDLSCRSSGSTLPSMTFDAYYSIDVFLPSLEIQKKMADSIFLLIDKKSLNEKIIHSLDNQAQTIYDYWFNQFDFPNEEGKPYKSSGGKMVWNDELKREIPEGWKSYHLKDVVSKEKYAIVDGPFGTQMKIEDYVNEGVPVYEMDQLNGLFVMPNFKHFISEEKYETVRRSSVKKGDILISKTGTLGLLGIANPDSEKGILVSRLAKITPDEKKIGKYTLLIYLQELTDSGYWLQKSGGSTMPILNNSILENVPMIMPNSNLYLKFEELITPIFSKIYSIQRENETLVSLRDFLLPMLMNGQATISD